jgi:hypothetical protein
MADGVLCVGCNALLPADAINDGPDRTPCPVCGSLSRKFLVTAHATMRYSGGTTPDPLRVCDLRIGILVDRLGDLGHVARVVDEHADTTLASVELRPVGQEDDLALDIAEHVAQLLRDMMRPPDTAQG